MDKTAVHNWKEHPVTVWAMEQFRDLQREQAHKALELGEMSDCQEMALELARTRGVYEGIDQIFRLRGNDEE